MSFVRKSHYRHVYGELFKIEQQYSGMKGTGASLDCNMIKVNGKYITYITAGTGGGAVTVFPMTQVGRHTVSTPMIRGHTRPVTDMDFNPFDTVLSLSIVHCYLSFNLSRKFLQQVLMIAQFVSGSSHLLVFLKMVSMMLMLS